jgi:phosphonate transport system permease protein
MPRPAYPALPPLLADRPWRLWPWGLVGVLALAGITDWHLRINFTVLMNSGSDFIEYLSRYSTPSREGIGTGLVLMGQTLAMALWGTLLAGVMGFILAPLACRVLSPHPVVYRVVRELLCGCRALPDLALALLLVDAIGLGALPGVLALAIHCTGFLGKFYAECMERVDRGTYDAIRATGASWPQLLMYAAWPAILRESLGYLFYIFDRNVRMASVLALVGAGGIGQQLSTALHLFEYQHALTQLLIIFLTLLVVEHASSWIRTRLT